MLFFTAGVRLRRRRGSPGAVAAAAPAGGRRRQRQPTQLRRVRRTGRVRAAHTQEFPQAPDDQGERSVKSLSSLL